MSVIVFVVTLPKPLRDFNFFSRALQKQKKEAILFVFLFFVFCLGSVLLCVHLIIVKSSLLAGYLGLDRLVALVTLVALVALSALVALDTSDALDGLLELRGHCLLDLGKMSGQGLVNLDKFGRRDVLEIVEKEFTQIKLFSSRGRGDKGSESRGGLGGHVSGSYVPSKWQGCDFNFFMCSLEKQEKRNPLLFYFYFCFLFLPPC